MTIRVDDRSGLQEVDDDEMCVPEVENEYKKDKKSEANLIECRQKLIKKSKGGRRRNLFYFHTSLK